MATLTIARFNQVQAIFDSHGVELLREGEIDFHGFEKELSEALSIGYRELKDIMIDLALRPEYIPLATAYMEDGYPCVAIEFFQPLAEIYGAEDFHAIDIDSKRKAFWSHVLPNRKLD